MEAPKEIWLQWESEGESYGDGEWDDSVTWCADRINDTDVRYVRADAQPAAPEPDVYPAPGHEAWYTLTNTGAGNFQGIGLDEHD